MHRLQIAYWMCAFSINQHASICGSFGPPPPEGTSTRLEWEAKKLDTATGLELPVCDCCEPKHFNADRECELNKFQDMMRHLANTSENFGQVVAVDEKFQLFSRAWCIAELVEADRSGISQTIQIHSAASVDRHYDCLATLDVRDCKASREEDKELILRKISDVDLFNSKLQSLILGEDGLFKDCVDAVQRSRIAAKLLQRALNMTDGPAGGDAFCANV